LTTFEKLSNLYQVRFDNFRKVVKSLPSFRFDNFRKVVKSLPSFRFDNFRKVVKSLPSFRFDNFRKVVKSLPRVVVRKISYLSINNDIWQTEADYESTYITYNLLI